MKVVMKMIDKKLELKNMIKNSHYIVFLTGAGISVPSGIPDFRSSSGIYSDKNSELSPERILSHSFFMKNPKTFYDFYKNKMIYLDAKPNIAHEMISKIPNVKAVITQNIDGLHQKAKSKNVIELHGSIYQNHCMKCGKAYSIDYVMNSKDIPKCSCGGIIKPNVILYEEPLNEKTLEDSIYHIEHADLLIVVGTSLLVNPAAGLVTYFKGSNLVIINKSKTPYDLYAKLIIRDNLENILNHSLLE